MFLRQMPTSVEDARHTGIMFFHFYGEGGGDNSFNSFFFFGLATMSLILSCSN